MAGTAFFLADGSSGFARLGVLGCTFCNLSEVVAFAPFEFVVDGNFCAAVWVFGVDLVAARMEIAFASYFAGVAFVGVPVSDGVTLSFGVDVFSFADFRAKSFRANSVVFSLPN